MAGSSVVQIHKVPGTCYPQGPALSANISWGDVARSGASISVNVSGSLVGLGGGHYFGYAFNVYAQLDDGPLVTIASKGNDPRTWNDGACGAGGTCTSTNTTTACTLKLYMHSTCTGCGGGLALMWSTPISAPAYGYTVTFKSSSGTILKTELVAVGGDATPPAAPVVSGYTFSSWSGTYKNVRSDSVVTATYTRNHYTVKYDLNGGTGTFNDQTKYGGTDLTLRSGTPTYTITITLDGNGGSSSTFTLTREFKCWKKKNGTKTYDPGDSYTKNANLTLVAQWKSASVDLSSRSPSTSKSVTLTCNHCDGTTSTYNRTLVFKGWFTQSSGGDQITSDTTKNNKTYYAQWKGVKILSSDPEVQKPTHSKWIFRDWYHDTSYNNKVDADDTMSANKTIYAKWAYKIFMKGNGGELFLNSWDPEKVTVKENGRDVEYEIVPTKETDVLKKEHDVNLKIPSYDLTYVASGGEVNSGSHTFIGWNTKANGNGTMYQPGNYITVNDTLTLYAIWKQKTFTVTFVNGYEPEVILGQYTVLFGEDVTEIPKNPERSGYSFSGWRGSWKNVRSNRKIVAIWNFSPIWIRRKNPQNSRLKEWVSYEPRENK